jgi:hypothetical protein
LYIVVSVDIFHAFCLSRSFVGSSPPAKDDLEIETFVLSVTDLRRIKTRTAMMMAIRAMPPITPPAMAPVLDDAEFIAAGVNNADMALSVDSVVSCNVFDCFVMKGESVKVGEVKKKTYVPTNIDQTAILNAIYYTERTDAKYVDEEMNFLGNVQVPLEGKGLDREVEALGTLSSS